MTRGYVLGVLAALLAGLSYFASVNRYAAMFGREMTAYDCDGPMRVGMFLGPALLLSIIAVTITARVLRRQRTAAAVGALLLSVFALVIAAVRVPTVIAEHRENIALDSPCS